jgi:hypothetical protein
MIGAAELINADQPKHRLTHEQAEKRGHQIQQAHDQCVSPGGARVPTER